MELLSATGQVIFAIFLAASQFLEPLRPDYVTKIEERRQIQDWERVVYDFSPKSLGELYNLSNDELAFYIRNSCLSMLDYTLPEKSRNKGFHFSAKMSDLVLNTADIEVLEELQKKLIEPEEEFVLKDSLEFFMRACDKDFPLEFLSQFNLRQALDRYAAFYNEIPEWSSAEDLPKLPELSFIKDLEGNIVGEFSKTDTLKHNEQVHTVRKNRRVITHDIPLLLKQALVSIEDARFWNFKPEGSEEYKGHGGIEFKSFLRAGQSSASGSGVQGGSTLTMQLAKNLILYNDVFLEHINSKRSMFRKIRELILTHRLERLLSKDQILDLYLNTIDFGKRSQGVEMASRTYFGKSASELNLQEMAMIAALPKGPNFYNPASIYPKVVERAKKRRNLVLLRMFKEGYISQKDYQTAKASKLKVVSDSLSEQRERYAHFYISQVQNQVNREYGEYSGHQIQVPINHDLQKISVDALQRGLLGYERKRGRLSVRSYEDKLPNIKTLVEEKAKEKKTEDLISVYPEVLESINSPLPDADQFKIGVILSDSKIGLADGTQVNRQPSDRSGKLYKLVSKKGKKKNLEVWDTVYLQAFKNSKGNIYYRIASSTEVQGGVVVLDIKTGDVLATSGGFSIGSGARYRGPHANRAFNSFRQPGSTVKPFTYLYALQKGMNPYNSISNLRMRYPKRDDRSGEKLCNPWAPKSTKRKANSLKLSDALAYSQNYATLNLLASASGALYRNRGNYLDYNGYSNELSEGLEDVFLLMKRFGVYDINESENKVCHPILLGSKETSVARMAAAYATIARGGEYKKPNLIIDINHNSPPPAKEFSLDTITISDSLDRTEVLEKLPLDTYRLRVMLQRVLKSGTASKLMKDWSHLIAGKTGTTDLSNDTWFVGFNKNIAVAVWVGYPNNRKLGGGSEGASVALPIFKDIMEKYYQIYPDELENTFDGPPVGLVEVRIEPRSGFIVDANLQEAYQYYTGRRSAVPSSPEYTVDGRDNLVASGGHYQGVVTEALARLFVQDLDRNRRRELESIKTRETENIAREYHRYKDYCDYYVGRGYRKSDLSECGDADDLARKYHIYNDFEKFFSIYYGFKQWESFL